MRPAWGRHFPDLLAEMARVAAAPYRDPRKVALDASWLDVVLERGLGHERADVRYAVAAEVVARPLDACPRALVLGPLLAVLTTPEARQGRGALDEDGRRGSFCRLQALSHSQAHLYSRKLLQIHLKTFRICMHE